MLFLQSGAEPDSGIKPMTFADIALASIGHTPIVKLNHSSHSTAHIFAKCEFLNPSGSHKDRLYSYAIEKLESARQIKPGMTLIDFSSGNAGSALAFVGKLKGYKVTVVRPAGLSRGKVAQMAAYGARVQFTPLRLGVPGAREAALRLKERLGSRAHLMFQTESHLNAEAYQSCGCEIVQFFADQKQPIDAFVCGIGTGGTLTGVAKIIKQHYPDALIFAVEVAEAAVLHNRGSGRAFTPRKHNLEGLSTGEIYSALDAQLIDHVLLVTQRQAVSTQREIIQEEGMFVGPTSGVSLFAARRAARQLLKNANVVTVFWDSGWKYLAEMRLPESVERNITTEKFL